MVAQDVCGWREGNNEFLRMCGLSLLYNSLHWLGLGWVGLGWVGLGWVGLGWVGLGWVGLGWVGLDYGILLVYCIELRHSSTITLLGGGALILL
jgi:hypothetical protein